MVSGKDAADVLESTGSPEGTPIDLDPGEAGGEGIQLYS